MSPVPPPGEPTRLSHRELATLAAIATHERGADPRFAGRLSAGPAGVARDRGRSPLRSVAVVVGVLAALGVLLLVLPGQWALAVAAVVVLVLGPTVLVVWALRQGDPPH